MAMVGPAHNSPPIRTTASTNPIPQGLTLPQWRTSQARWPQTWPGQPTGSRTPTPGSRAADGASHRRTSWVGREDEAAAFDGPTGDFVILLGHVSPDQPHAGELAVRRR